MALLSPVCRGRACGRVGGRVWLDLLAVWTVDRALGRAWAEIEGRAGGRLVAKAG